MMQQAPGVTDTVRMWPLLATHPILGAHIVPGAGCLGAGRVGTTSEEECAELDATSKEESKKLGKGLPSLGMAGCAAAASAAASR